ncbi:hypothetical protein MML48_9g00016516 [Holotrichia oblita]|nr:hypothetical protein MML48_9g00016516 [Holotrichia oblita]
MVILLGHSYGGLISMIFALFYPDLVEKLIIVEMTPRDQTKNFRHIWTVLDTIDKIKVPPKIPMSLARKLMNQEMEQRKMNKDDRLFLLTQLIQKTDGKKKFEPDTQQYFPKAEFRYVSGAGHSVHADKPRQFLEICSEFLNRDS